MLLEDVYISRSNMLGRYQQRSVFAVSISAPTPAILLVNATHCIAWLWRARYPRSHSLVGTVGFEPTLTRFQTEDVDQATPRPVVTSQALNYTTCDKTFMLFRLRLAADFLAAT
jgi:hypothetical protein